MFIVVMGVSGSGKTTVGKMLAVQMGCHFYEGDEFHPPANVAKMSTGIPLNDEDRAGWLAALVGLIQAGLKNDRCSVMACSALKAKYRRVLNVDPLQVRFVYLRGSFELILPRLEHRRGHFMKPRLLRSQFADLEEPAAALVMDVHQTPEMIVQKIMEQLMEQKYALGILGLGVMGRSLAQNFERHGYPVIGYDILPRPQSDYSFKITDVVEKLTNSLAAPRTILIMVPAGAPVDTAIASVKPYLQRGDILIDGGNSYFEDTARRLEELRADGILFVGMGVSGGERGALWGPSLMPGGEVTAWDHLKPALEAIAARAEDGRPCVTWIGPGGAGHYVKMVHNGIEYGDMQLIAEIYDLLHRGADIPNNELADIFNNWNTGPLRSYLIEITAGILAFIDPDTGQSLVDLIVDEAGQKGTGVWASHSALQLGMAVPSINAAVESRFISALRTERQSGARLLGSSSAYTGDQSRLVRAAEEALFASKVTSYAQGMALLAAASTEFNWKLNLAEIVRIWRAGCIIRAAFMDDIAAAYEHKPQLPSLILDDFFQEALLQRQSAWREVIQTAIGLGIPLPGASASLAYYDSYRSARLPANLIQAQRDYFGSHTYARLDKEGIFHTDWEAKPDGSKLS